MTNTVTNKIKHFLQLFALGPQTPLKQKLLQFPPLTAISTQLDKYVHKYKEAQYFSGSFGSICLVIQNRLIRFLA